MRYDDDDDDLVFGERINARAARQLIERHPKEYDDLVNEAAQARIDSLQAEIATALREIAHLKSMNPDGVNAPALTATANALVTANDELTNTVRALTRRAEKLAKENRKLRDLVSETKEG